MDRVIGLCRVDGSLDENPTNIQGMLSDHFQKIFSANPMTNTIFDARNYCLKMVPHNISICNQDRLDKDFTKEEIFNALTSMKSCKSLGIDGLHCEFYKAMSGTMGDYFCCIVHEVFSSSFLSQFINKGIIKLISKNFRRNTISGQHPITLLGVSYNFFPKH